eukprot:scaffold442873_cov45-Prasinocladus_malaysianus.AAC.1
MVFRLLDKRQHQANILPFTRKRAGRPAYVVRVQAGAWDDLDQQLDALPRRGDAGHRLGAQPPSLLTWNATYCTRQDSCWFLTTCTMASNRRTMAIVDTTSLSEAM